MVGIVFALKYTKVVMHKKFAHHFLPHQKEDGLHHRAKALNLSYLVSYLLILVVFGSGLYLIKLKAPQILGQATFSSDQIITLTNSKRAQNGLGLLAINSQLAQAATSKAGDMYAADYWAHNSPSGKTPWSFISAAGYRYLYAGENLARDFSDASSVVEAWMASSSHRSNILDDNFKEIGVAVTSGDLAGREVVLVVQMFGTPVSQIPATQPLAQENQGPSLSQTSPAPSPAQVAQIQEKPSPVPLPSPELTPSPSAAALAVELPSIQEGQNTQATVLASRRFALVKGVSLALTAFVFLLFAIEVLYTLRKSHLRLRSGVLAHLAILAFVLLAIWYAVGGAII